MNDKFNYFPVSNKRNRSLHSGVLSEALHDSTAVEMWCNQEGVIWHTVVLSEALYHCTAVETFHNQEDVVLAISARLVLLNSSRILDY